MLMLSLMLTLNLITMLSMLMMLIFIRLLLFFIGLWGGKVAKRFRGLRYTVCGNGDYLIQIYDKNDCLLVSMIVSGNKVRVVVGDVVREG